MNITQMSQGDELTICHKIINMWNNELGFIFPIPLDVFYQNTFKDPNFEVDNSFYLEENGEIIAVIIAKRWKRQEIIANYDKRGWISLLYVSPRHRRKGIGTELLLKVLNSFKEKGIEEVFVGRDYRNFFPGIPMDLKMSIPWFVKRGCEIEYETNDLICELTKCNEKLKLRPYNTEKNVIIKFIDSHSELSGLLTMINQNWPGRWHLECQDYCNNKGDGREYLVALIDDKIVGFCKVCDFLTKTEHMSYSVTWANRFKALGGIGPLGVDRDFRKLNIAYNLIVTAINHLIDQKCDKIIIDWTNLLEFYRQFGFEIWKSYSYAKFKMEVKK